MSKSKLNRILDEISNDPELLALYETGFIGLDQDGEIPPDSKPFIPCYGTQSFQQAGHTYQFEIVSIPDGSARHTGRVF